MNIKPYWKYLLYVLEHKKNVFKACWKRKLYSHAIMHDMSKFSPNEFFAYAQYFYGNFGVKNQCPAKWTVPKCCKVKEDFDEAWKHHYTNNPHHWEYWLQTGVLEPIPEKYLRQMIADWEGMALKFGDTAQQYYLNHYKEIKLEYNTRVLLEYLLDINDSLTVNYGHTLEEFANAYDEDYYNCNFGYIIKKYGVDSYTLLKQGGN